MACPGRAKEEGGDRTEAGGIGPADAVLDSQLRCGSTAQAGGLVPWCWSPGWRGQPSSHSDRRT